MRRYHPKYCEENIWWLAASKEPGVPTTHRRVVFISSATQSCLLFGQKEHDPVVWDYHVVLWTIHEGGAWIWDLDSSLEVPCDAQVYLRTSFKHAHDPDGPQAEFAQALEQGAAQRALADGTPDPRLDLAPRFLVLDASEYVQGFSSNRQHMVGPGGEWYAPPPPWECIEEGELSLAELMHLKGPGRQHDLESLLACAAARRLP